MPVLNIEGKRVRVDDSFLQLSPEQQNATVEEIVRSMGGAAQTAPQTQPSDPAQGAPQPASAAPSVAQDLVPSFAAGVARGAADLVGLPGTVGNLIDSGGEWIQRKLGLPTRSENMRKLGLDPSMPLSGEKVRTGISAVTGGATDYQPQTTVGKYARTIGEFLPGGAAAGGSRLVQLGRYAVAPALASEAAGQATEGTDFEPFARIGGALVGGAIGSRLGASKAAKLPSAAEIKQSAGYGDDMTNVLRGARTTPKTYSDIVADLWNDVKQAGTSYEVQQNFGRTLQNEMKLVQQEGASLHSLERLRRALRSAGGGKLDTPNQAIANRLIDKLDDAVEHLSASSIAASGETGRPVLDMLKQARTIYRTGKKADLIETAVANAQNAASGVENGLRTEFRKLLKPNVAKNFTKTEQYAIRQVAKGNFKSNALRFLGTFGFPIDQGRNWLGALAGSSAAGSMAGSAFGPGIGTAVGAGVSLGGTAAKYGALRATRQLADRADALVKAGPDAGRAFAQALDASKSANRELILRSFLQTLQAPGMTEGGLGTQGRSSSDNRPAFRR